MRDIRQQLSNLSPQEKRALLQRLLEKQESDSPAVFPLSYGQQALWFLEQLSPESGAYNEPLIWQLNMRINRGALQQALQLLVDRHTALRTVYVLQDNRVLQKVLKSYALDFSIVDATAWNTQQIQAHLNQEVYRPIDLERGPIFRAQLLVRSETEQLLAFITHHIAIDTWSYMVLLDELSQLYTALVEGRQPSLPDLKITYQDYVHWQLEMLTGSQGQAMEAYWRHKLGEPLPVLQFPTDHLRGTTQTFMGAAYTFMLSSRIGRQLKQVAQARGVTLYTLLLAAFQVLLYRYSGQDDILINTPTNGRSRAIFDGVVGYFVNPVIMRTHLTGQQTFTEVLQQVHQTVMEALTHQDYPFSLLVDRLQPQRHPARSPFSDVAFVMEQLNRSSLVLPQDEDKRRNVFAEGATGAYLELRGLKFEFVNIERRRSKFDLELQITVAAETIFGSFLYNTDLFEKETIEDFSHCFETLLQSVLVNPEQAIDTLPILAQGARQHLLFDWNDTSAVSSGTMCLHTCIEQQAERTPDHPAVVFQDRQLTYRELNSLANQLAHYLRQAGVESGVNVGLYIDRSLEFIVGMLAILKAGGVYVPLDTALPAERLRFILQDTQIQILLSQDEVSLSGPEQIKGIVLDQCWSDIKQQPASSLASSIRPDDLAYIISTSGSTGRPKGVMIRHDSIVNYARAFCDQLACSTGWSFATVSTLAADLGNTAIFCALTTGGCLHIVPYDIATDGRAFAHYMHKNALDVLKIVPTHLQSLLATGGRDVLPMRALILGGEALSWKLVEQIYDLEPDCVVFNHYGPTEATIGTLTHKIDYSTMNSESRQGGTVPIGRPLPDTQAYVLDHYQQPVPLGVAGELYIGGVGLARGYWNRPELTRERFVADPFSLSEGARLYRTGDIVRRHRNGVIEFLGRRDNQVKIRGYRIEPAEIELCLTRHEYIEECAVIATESKEPGGQRLVAYLVTKNGITLSVSDLHRWLREQLPDYMIPAAFIHLDTLPISSNGKLHRAALPVPDETRPQLDVGYMAPETEIEHAIAHIWRSVLHLDQVGVRDNFFELGGNSLLMAEVHRHLQTTLAAGRDISLATLFRYPSVESLATFLAQPQERSDALEEGKARANLRLRQSRRLQNRRYEQRAIQQREGDHNESVRTE